jgi:glycosyltransferase involved in cell wall biosynthesis
MPRASAEASLHRSRPAAMTTESASAAAATKANGRPLTVMYVDLNTVWRGGQRQIFWMAQGLARRGGRPVLALRPHAVLAQRARAAGLEVMPIDPLVAEWGPMTVLRLRRIVAREGVDILHPQCGHSMALCALAALGTETRVIFARRVTSPLRHGAATRIKYGRADRFIAVCRAAVPALLDAGIDANRVDVVYSGVDLARAVEPATATTLAELGVPNGSGPRVVMVGALTQMKDPLTFVRAIDVARRSVPSVQALLVGDGQLRAPVEALIRELGLEYTLHLAGFRSDADALMCAGQVVVLSSDGSAEGIGGVVIDAISFGRPVAATAAGGIPEVIEHERTGLLVPIGDATALGQAIVRLLTDDALAARLVAAGLARSRDFAIEKTVDGTIAVYQKTLATTT